MTLLVTGASGNVGRHVLDGLRAAGHPVRASSRDPSRARLPAGVPTVAADLQRPETLPAALEGISRVFLYAQEERVDGFIEAARAAGVEHVVFLSSASVVEPGAESNAIARHHLVIERALAASGLAWTFLRPGGFATNALQWAPSLRAGDVLRWPYPEAEESSIHERDIADVAVVALTGTSLRGAAPVLSGPESLTHARRLELIGQALGRTLRFEALSAEQASEGMRRFMPAPIVDQLLTYWRDAVGVPARISHEVERITGRPARTFAQWAREHVADFR